VVVFVFYEGYFKNGYLGVGVFFVISGYLITKIIYDEIVVGEFSVKNSTLGGVKGYSSEMDVNP
jgi:peptidoglycan/LPS O-acetylase OafA/YrhL